MKKILTICVFTFALLISSQGIAQVKQANNASIEKASIKQDVKKISSTLGLNAGQIDAFAKAYANKEKAYKNETLNLTDEVKNKIQQKFLGSLKGILTEDQITKLKSLNQEK